MRISKKFAGDKCLGKQIYLRRAASAAEAEAEAPRAPRRRGGVRRRGDAPSGRAGEAAARRGRWRRPPTQSAAAPRARPRPRRRTAPRRGTSCRRAESVGSGRDADDAASSSSDDDAAARRYGAAVPRRRGESPVRFKRLGSATAPTGSAAPARRPPRPAPRSPARRARSRRRTGAPGRGALGRRRLPQAAAPRRGAARRRPNAAARAAAARARAVRRRRGRRASGTRLLRALAIARGASSERSRPSAAARARADSRASEGALLLTAADAPDDFAALRDDGPLDLDDAAWLDAFDSTTQVAAARAA